MPLRRPVPRRRHDRAALLLTTALAVLPGCTERLAYRSDTRENVEVPVPPGTREIRVEVPEGAITFREGAPGVVTGETVTRKLADTEPGFALLEPLEGGLRPGAAEPGVLLLRGPAVPEGVDGVAHRVITKSVLYVPPDVAIVGISALGHMAAIGHRGAVRLETGHGVVRVDSCVGPTVVRDDSGDSLIVDHHRGDLDIEVGRCETMQVFVDELGPNGVRMVSVQGSMQLHLPADADFELDAETSTGRAKNGFGVPIEPLPHSGNAMRGTANAGGPRVLLRIVDRGNVSINARNPR